MDQLIIHKPAGIKISDQMMAKIRKEYTNSEIFYCYKGQNQKWFYSKERPELISLAAFLESEFDSFLVFDKGTHYTTKPNPVHFREAEDGVQWFLNATVGTFSFLSGANDRCSGILFNTFLKFCDLISLNSFLKEACRRYGLKSFVITASGSVKHGAWFEYEGCHYTTLDFSNKLTYDAKTTLKNLLAFCTNPQEFKQEVLRLEKLTDYEIRVEAAKVPEVNRILQQIG